MGYGYAIPVTLPQIADLAGVSRPAAANWPKRYPDSFPEALVETQSGSLYDLDEVAQWLWESGRITEPLDPFLTFLIVADSLRGNVSVSEMVAGLIAILIYFEAVNRGLSTVTLPIDLNAQRAPTDESSEDVGYLLSIWKQIADEVADSLPEQLGSSLWDDIALLIRKGEAATVRRLFHALGEYELFSDFDGQAIELFEEMMRRYYAEDRSRSEYSTPPELGCLMSRLVEPVGPRLLDPCVGSGGLLLSTSQSALELGILLEVDGFDVDVSISKITAARFWIYDVPATIETKDALVENIDQLYSYDTVVADPPYGMANWADRTSYTDQKWIYGPPPARSADTAWLQLVAEALTAGGKGVVALPPGATFRGGAEGAIREAMVEDGVVEAVIALPGRLRSDTAVQTTLWVLKSPELRENVRQPILLVDATSMGTSGRSKTTLEESEIDLIVEIMKEYRTSGSVSEPHRTLAVAMPIEELVDGNLSPQRYLVQAEQSHESLIHELTGLRTEVIDLARNVEIAVRDLTSSLGDRHE